MTNLARALSQAARLRHVAYALQREQASVISSRRPCLASTAACQMQTARFASSTPQAGRAPSISQKSADGFVDGDDLEAGKFDELEENREEEEDGWLDNDDEELELPEASTSSSHSDGAFIDVDKAVWGRKALEAAQKVLRAPEMDGLDLYSFRAVAKGAVLDVRLDKLDDKYGSPMLEDIETFARALYREMESMMGEEEAGEITVEASSPGAERKLRIPRELTRFRELPMTVSYHAPGDSAKTYSRVFQLADLDEAEGTSVWQLSNVRINRPSGKGTKLTKKQAAERFTIALRDLDDVRLYIEL